MLKSHFAIGPIALAALATLMPAVSQAASDPKGVWLNDTGRGAVEIKNCGGALCGHVVWVKDGADAKGCGKQIIGEARHAGGSTWDGGWVYSPEKKRRYDVELTPLGDGKLRVVGYAGVKLFSKTMIWKRAPADLQRCGSTETAAKTATPEPAPVAPVAAAPAETKAPELKTPELKAAGTTSAQVKTSDVKVPDVKPPEVKEPVVKTTETLPSSRPEAAPDVTKPATAGAPKAITPSQSAAGPASEPASENDKTAQADEESDPSNDDEPSSNGKINLGDIDVSKFLKKTRAGNCQLDLPWVKIEFGCE